jgi:phage baseplate assembly protein W
VVQRISRQFKDISLSFDMHPVTRDILVLKDADAIKRSIRNIVQTLPGERFFNPNIGSNLTTSLFDFVDFGSASTIQTQIRNAVISYEPRVDNIRVEVIPKPDENSFEVNVYFNIIGQDFPQQQFTYILEATRR